VTTVHLPAIKIVTLIKERSCLFRYDHDTYTKQSGGVTSSYQYHKLVGPACIDQALRHFQCRVLPLDDGPKLASGTLSYCRDSNFMMKSAISLAGTYRFGDFTRKYILH
jgi:hypothetical protein